MINPSLFTILNANSGVKSLLGENPLRVYPWARAPQDVKLPYAVYGVINGTSENYLDRVPDMDRKGTQITIYAVAAETLENCYIAVRNALEPHGHMLSFSTPDQDDNTDFYSCRMEFDFLENR